MIHWLIQGQFMCALMVAFVGYQTTKAEKGLREEHDSPSFINGLLLCKSQSESVCFQFIHCF